MKTQETLETQEGERSEIENVAIILEQFEPKEEEKE